MILAQQLLRLLIIANLTSDQALALYQCGWTTEAHQARLQKRIRRIFWLTPILVILLLITVHGDVKFLLLSLLFTLVTLYAVMFFYLTHHQKLRTQRLNKELPSFIEGLLLAGESGLSLQQSFERIGQHLPNHVLLKRELIICHHQLQSGLPLIQVLDFMLERNPVMGLERLVILLKSHHRLGHELNKNLIHESERHYYEQQHDIKSKSAALNLRLLMPLLGCFLPSLMLILISPSLLQLVHFFA